MNQNVENLKSDISNLVNKWINRERSLRYDSNFPFNREMVKKANTIHLMRRELQEIANLVVKPEEL